MPLFLWVRMFVKRRSAKPDQRLRIVGKLNRHPIQNDADAFLVTTVHQQPKLVRTPERARRCVQSDGMIAQRALEIVLAYGQKLDVGKPHFLYVLRQLLGKFTIRQEARILLRLAPLVSWTRLPCEQRSRAGFEEAVQSGYDPRHTGTD
jgi:hypothetical protein